MSQGFNYSKTMVTIEMTSPILLWVNGREACLWVKGSFRSSKELRPKRHLNIWKKEKSNEVKDFMKVEKRGKK